MKSAKSRSPARTKVKVRSNPHQKGLNRARIKKALEDAFRKEFPRDTVDISDGYQDNIHVLVVSRKFDHIGEQDKQDMMWGIIDSTPLTEPEKRLISLVLPLSPIQLK